MNSDSPGAWRPKDGCSASARGRAAAGAVCGTRVKSAMSLSSLRIGQPQEVAVRGVVVFVKICLICTRDTDTDRNLVGSFL